MLLKRTYFQCFDGVTGNSWKCNFPGSITFHQHPARNFRTTAISDTRSIFSIPFIHRTQRQFTIKATNAYFHAQLGIDSLVLQVFRLKCLPEILNFYQNKPPISERNCKIESFRLYNTEIPRRYTQLLQGGGGESFEVF